jgi:hypothetical protein
VRHPTTSSLALGLVLLACSGERASFAPLADDAGAQCPLDLATSNGAGCGKEGLECAFDVPCQVTNQLVRCTCRASRWSCRDATGDLPAGASPRCVDPDPPAQEPCPPTMREAQGGGCTNMGRACFYDGDLCESGITKLDYCSCKRAKEGSLAYACRHVRCPEAYLGSSD